MKYWDFTVKSKWILPLVATSEDTFFISMIMKMDFLRILGLHCYPKEGWNVGYLSEIMQMTLTFPDWTADVTYCADVTLFQDATSG